MATQGISSTTPIVAPAATATGFTTIRDALNKATWSEFSVNEHGASRSISGKTPNGQKIALGTSAYTGTSHHDGKFQFAYFQIGNEFVNLGPKGCEMALEFLKNKGDSLELKQNSGSTYQEDSPARTLKSITKALETQKNPMVQAWNRGGSIELSVEHIRSTRTDDIIHVKIGNYDFQRSQRFSAMGFTVSIGNGESRQATRAEQALLSNILNSALGPNRENAGRFVGSDGKAWEKGISANDPRYKDYLYILSTLGDELREDRMM